jgi:hypothetical protein
MPAQPGSGSREAFMEFLVDSNNGVAFYQSGSTNLTMRRKTAGAADQTAVAYDAVAMRWLRIRESGGTLYWDTSPDGNTWTNQRTYPHTLNLSVGSISFSAGFYGTETADTLFVDNVNNPPVVGVTQQASVPLVAVSTLTAAATAFHVLAGSAPLVATSTLSAGAVRAVPGSVPLTASSTLSVGVERAVQGTAVGIGIQQGSVILVAASTLSLAGTREQVGSAPLVAASTLSVGVTAFHVLAATVAMSATSTLSAGAVRDAPSGLALTSVATLSAIAVRVQTVQVLLSAVSNLMAVVTPPAVINVIPNVAGDGTLYVMGEDRQWSQCQPVGGGV